MELKRAFNRKNESIRKKNEKKDESLSSQKLRNYNLNRFDHSVLDSAKKYVERTEKKFQKNAKNSSFYKALVLKRIPILNWLPKYDAKESLISDMVAGLTVGIINIPQVTHVY